MSSFKPLMACNIKTIQIDVSRVVGVVILILTFQLSSAPSAWGVGGKALIIK